MTKSGDILNKKPRVQKGEANQKQQLSDYTLLHNYIQMWLKALISAEAKN